MALIERQASSLAQIFAEASFIRDQWNPERDACEEVWFRGQHKRSFRLLPNLYRPATLECEYDEVAIFHAFINLGLAYTVQRPASDWEWYFVAQHHGLPTRLLDWTESLLAATYFAVEQYSQVLDSDGSQTHPSAEPIFDEDSPTIWVVDAGSVNNFSQGQDVLFAPREEIKCYLPRFLESPVLSGGILPGRPIAVYPQRQSPRIIAQQGMFTLHGRDRTSLDAMIAIDSENLIKLGCIQLDRSRLGDIVDQLALAGVTRLSLFPDLDSVAAQIRWQY